MNTATWSRWRYSIVPNLVAGVVVPERHAGIAETAEIGRFILDRRENDLDGLVLPQRKVFKSNDSA